MNCSEAYVLSKRYTEESLIGVGALKGASCQIKSMVKKDGVNTVTFLWVDNNGDSYESQMLVSDGTPIYAWTSGDTYNIGDLAIYNNCFYKCVSANSDIVFNPTRWIPIGSSDSKYDIVENSQYLQPLSSDVRKMVYSIDDTDFFLWNGTSWVKQGFKSTYSVDGENLQIN